MNFAIWVLDNWMTFFFTVQVHREGLQIATFGKEIPFTFAVACFIQVALIFDLFASGVPFGVMTIFEVY